MPSLKKCANPTCQTMIKKKRTCSPKCFAETQAIKGLEAQAKRDAIIARRKPDPDAVMRNLFLKAPVTVLSSLQAPMWARWR